MDGIQYLEGENPLGIALSAMMKLPKERIAELGAEALRRISETELTDQKKFLLGECFEAYLPIDEEAKAKLDGILQTETYKGVKAMNVTTYERGIEKGRIDAMEEIRKQMATNVTTYERGIEKGIEKGRILMLTDLLKDRLEKKFESEGLRWFASLPVELGMDRLLEVLAEVGEAKSIADLKAF